MIKLIYFPLFVGSVLFFAPFRLVPWPPFSTVQCLLSFHFVVVVVFLLMSAALYERTPIRIVCISMVGVNYFPSKGRSCKPPSSSHLGKRRESFPFFPFFPHFPSIFSLSSHSLFICAHYNNKGIIIYVHPRCEYSPPLFRPFL